jgi:hypothetical protein
MAPGWGAQEEETMTRTRGWGPFTWLSSLIWTGALACVACSSGAAKTNPPGTTGGGSSGSSYTGGSGGAGAGGSGGAGAGGSGGAAAGSGGAGSGGSGSGGADAGSRDTAPMGDPDGAAPADAALVDQKIRVRFLQAYVRQGKAGQFDIGAGDREGRWSVLARNVAYGTLTDFYDVTVDPGHYAFFWFVPPGSNPADFGRGDNEINFVIDPGDTGPHTLFFSYTDDLTQFSGQLTRDDDPALTPPAGYAYLAIYTAAIRASYPTLDYGPAGGCFDRANQDNYQPVPAGMYVYSLYDGAAANDCKGPRIVSAPATAFGDRQVWMLYAMGDKTLGFDLRPVKLVR